MRQFDVIFVLPYLFSDHPSFPEGILKRILEAEGYSVGVIQTPFWQKPESFSILGKPNLFFAIIGGPVDSTVLNYTSTRKRRKEDLYQENSNGFFPEYPKSIKYKIRPDQTILVFANRLRQVFKNTPIIIGGLEASLRCFVHYDFQKDRVKRSILLDSRADLLVSGMGEKQLLAIAGFAREGALLKNLNIKGTARVCNDISPFSDFIPLPSWEDIQKEPSQLMDATLKVESARIANKGIIQNHGDRFVVAHPMDEYKPDDLDRFYSLPYTRAHLNGQVSSKALKMNLFSVTSHRGCGGGCSFCSLALHEGKQVISRSVNSILQEINSLKNHPQWKGIVSDIGGATAEFYGSDCNTKSCRRISCLSSSLCKQLHFGNNFLELLQIVRGLKEVKKVFLGSGVRYDLLLRNPELLEEILYFHSGRFLRVAPEHTEPNVLTLMRKPGTQLFEEFLTLFNRINSKRKRKVELAPYIIVGHPGETIKDVHHMARYFRKWKLRTTDVQIFTPTPGTLSTAMYYAAISPDFKPIAVEKNVNALVKRKHIITG